MSPQTQVLFLSRRHFAPPAARDQRHSAIRASSAQQIIGSTGKANRDGQYSEDFWHLPNNWPSFGKIARLPGDEAELTTNQLLPLI